MVDNPNWPVESWAALFSANPNSTNTNTAWSGLSDRVLGFRSGYGAQYELGTPEAGDCELALLNEDEALNPANTSSPFNSGGNLLLPYRRLLGTATWPSTDASGNLLNATNAAQWGQSTDTSTFEGAGLGEWIISGSTPPAIVNSTTRAQQGTRSMRITWPTAVNGGTNAVSLVWAPFQGPFKIGQQYTLSLYLWAAAGVPRMRVQFGGVVTTSPTNNSTWQRVTVSWTATAVWSAFQIYPDTNTTSGQQMWVDAVQVDLGPAASAFSTTGPIIYPLHAGFIERYPIAWEAQGYLGKANLTSVDANALLARAELMDCLSEDIQQDTPRVTLRLDDAGSLSATKAEWSKTSKVTSKAVAAGTGGAKPVFGYDSSPARDAPVMTSLNLAPVSNVNYTTIEAAWPTTLTALSTGSVELWFRAPAGSPSGTQVMLSAVAASGATHPLEIGLNTSGQVFVREVNNTTGPTLYYTITDTVHTCNEDWHHVVWVQTGTASRQTWLYVDGRVAGTATATHGASVYRPYAVYLGSPFNTGADPFAGQLAWVSVYDQSLTPERVSDHWRSATDGHDRDLPGVRLRRTLTWAGWNGPQSILDDGNTVMGPAIGYAGRTVADIARECAVTDNGFAVCQPDGDLTLVTRQALYDQTTASVVFGENPGEVPYQGDIAFDLDPQYVYNSVEVTGAGVTAAVATDAASQLTYFKSSLSVSTAAARTQDCEAYRDDLLGRYKDAHLRVSEITINPAANPTLWPVALGLKFGDRVTVNRRTQAFTMTGDYIVLNRSHETAPGKWLTKFQLVPVRTSQPWLIGDASYGQVGSTNVVAY